jgi:hypothetical protein
MGGGERVTMPDWTDAEGAELVRAFVYSRGKDGASEDDIEKWLDHLAHLKADIAITMTVAMGATRMTWAEGEDEPRLWANET